MDYASGKKVTVYFAGKNTVIAAGADLVYDYGKNKKMVVLDVNFSDLPVTPR